MVSHRRYDAGGFTIKCRFPRGCVDKVILLRWRSGEKGERRYREEETLWKPIKKFEKLWIALSGMRDGKRTEFYTA